MYFAQMCEYIDITRDDLYEELKKLESEKKILSSIRLVAKRQRSRKVCKNTKNRKVGSYNVTL